MKTLIRPRIIACACLFVLFGFVPEPTADDGSRAASSQKTAYVINNSRFTVYYKPENWQKNPGLDQDGAYPLAPGQALYEPVDAVVTPVMQTQDIFRVPDGSQIVIKEDGEPVPANLVAKAGVYLVPSRYGVVKSPCFSFAILANARLVLTRPSDIVASMQPVHIVNVKTFDM